MSSLPPNSSTGNNCYRSIARGEAPPRATSERDRKRRHWPIIRLQHLIATLEKNDLSVAVEATDTLTAERLGQTYRIRSDGSVEGDGALRAQLETIVQDAI